MGCRRGEVKAIVVAERLGVYNLPDADSKEEWAVFSGQELELGPLIVNHGLVWGWVQKPEEMDACWVATGPIAEQDRWIKRVKND